MLEAVRNRVRLPDLRQKLFVTIGLLTFYRLAANIPLPGVESPGAGRHLSTKRQHSAQFLEFLQRRWPLPHGGHGTGRLPYITASIILAAADPNRPRFGRTEQRRESGRARINQYTLWLAIPLAFLQAIAQGTLLSSDAAGGVAVLPNWGFSASGWFPTMTIIIGMTAGTLLGVWIGQLITEQGIGNGISLIIFAGILSSVPFQLRLLSQNWILLIVFIIVTIATIVLIVWIQEGQRRIPVQYGKRVRTMRGNRMMMVGGQSTYIPLRVNTAGMIPLIFSQSLLILPSTLASYFIGRSDLIRSDRQCHLWLLQPN
jgi:preprotein translocase subunit SecY